ncbi:hypothetical protein HMPREF1536_03323 [Parabacteroides gordonii MS-1 = DSM 23371]|uniref:Uncharacterized protein n=2 Tax=Parabacteroides gordonii TaxID=574930 RepID=A0A0F5JDN4_9BACT|nr:hypothetical protein HMPREF1536_03323 [Parabacteroides gordonii MS-1 = DSM 23371]
MKQTQRHTTLFASAFNFHAGCAASKGQNIVVSYPDYILYKEMLQLAEDSRSGRRKSASTIGSSIFSVLCCFMCSREVLNNQVVLYVSLFLTVLNLSSCIREELPACPPLQVILDVEDKNYHNINSAVRLGFEEWKSEELPFRDYVGTLTYRLHNAETGEEVLVAPVAPVEGDKQMLALPIPENLPFGTYVLTAWGNLAGSTILTEEHKGAKLHPDNLPGEDLYLAHDTLVYDHLTYDYTIGMKRVKGKLIIRVEDMPVQYQASSKAVTGLSGYVDNRFNYDRSLDMRLDTVWPAPREILTKTIMAPSLERDLSVLTLRFFEGNQCNESAYWISPEAVTMNMQRNELTIMRYVYDKSCCCFKIYILINDHWEVLHSMEIS